MTIEESQKHLRPENQPKKYDVLFTAIDSGQIKIPRFQRDFVWGKEQTAKLIDSLIKGFPIGTFILWNTVEELRHVRNIGNVELPDVPPGQAVQYILDGQQRITSLYAIRKGIRITRDGHEIDYRDISINLDMDPDSDESVVFVNPTDNATYISVYELLVGSVLSFLDKYTREQLGKIEVYQKRLTGYDFSTILIDKYPIDIACEVFTRINTGGTELTLFEIMVAKTFDQPRDFDLAQEYDKLLDNNGAGKDLGDANFNTLPSSTILQCVAMYLSKQVRRQDILKLNKYDFIDVWPLVKDGIFQAVDYLRDQLRVPVSQLLPYNALVVPLTYFFLNNGKKPPTWKQNSWLTQYFWWASLTNRFSSAVESKLAQDRERIDAILKGEPPVYRDDEELQLTMEDLRWRWFSTGDAFCKAIICLYVYFTPLSFATNSQVRIDNSWLKQQNSRNYHHFFPKAYLRGQGYDEGQSNSILNITLVDDYLNKRKIGRRAPSDYIGGFAADNPQIDVALRSHLIDDIHLFGVADDDYETFLEMRGQRVLTELNQRLKPVV
jgi:hypothetical protein